MKKIFICSPYQGNEFTNSIRAQKILREVLKQGNAPFAPHLLYTKVLEEKTGRNLGIQAGLEFLKVCDVILICGDKITAGMQQEIDFAKKNNIKLEHRAF